MSSSAPLPVNRRSAGRTPPCSRVENHQCVAVCEQVSKLFGAVKRRAHAALQQCEIHESILERCGVLAKLF